MKTLWKVLKWVGIVLLLLIALAGTLYMIYLRPFINELKATNVIQYDKNLTIIEGGGGNSGILVSDSLVLVIDTKFEDVAEMQYNMVKSLAGNKPILVVCTHDHSDHIGGNALYKGQTILAGANYTKEIWAKNAGEENMPTEWLKDKINIPMGDDTATIFNLAKDVHTESDVMVYLHRRKMLFSGDVILNGQIPALMGVADPDGYMQTFDLVQSKYNIQVIVPGHGPVGDLKVLETFRQYFKDMETAAHDEHQKAALIQKYHDWRQVPVIMSPAKTISVIRDKESGK